MKPVTTLIFIRHGETRLNVNQVFRGRTDIPLNETGLSQASRLGEELAGKPLQAVYSSPMTRAMQTAAAVAGPHGLTAVPLDSFHNICLGVWEGRAKAEIKEQFPDLWNQWVCCPDDLQIPGGETIPGLRRRTAEGIKWLLEEHPGEMVAVISHRSVLKAALAVVLGLERDYFWKFYLDNCSYSVIEHRPPTGFMITRLNEACHLPDRTTEVY